MRGKDVRRAVGVFACAFGLGPMVQLRGLKLMPGNIGDARLNNYFLEHLYQYVRGGTESLWHVDFFWPFPYGLGFSDNLFGAWPLYLAARLVTGASDTAFQLWFLCGYVANFGAAYYAVRKLEPIPPSCR